MFLIRYLYRVGAISASLGDEACPGSVNEARKVREKNQIEREMLFWSSVTPVSEAANSAAFLKKCLSCSMAAVSVLALTACDVRVHDGEFRGAVEIDPNSNLRGRLEGSVTLSGTRLEHEIAKKEDE